MRYAVISDIHSNPDTKAEIAVPIMLREQVLGVLDVQSNTLSSLSAEDQLLLVGLCGQIAIAIDYRRAETERRWAEEALLDSENRLGVIFNNSSGLQLLVSVEPDQTFRLAAINQRYINTVKQYRYNVSEQDFIGKTIEEVGLNVFGFDQTVIDHTLRYYRQVVKTGAVVRYDESFELPAGRYHAEVTLVPVFDGASACRYVLWSSHDITERKLAEEMIRRARRNLAEAQRMAR